MDKPNKVHDLQYYRLAQERVKEYGNLLNDLEKVEDILYNYVGYSDVWQIILKMTDAKVKYFTELEGWKETLETKGEVE